MEEIVIAKIATNIGRQKNELIVNSATSIFAELENIFYQLKIHKLLKL
jgi:hypothetical protein